MALEQTRWGIGRVKTVLAFTRGRHVASGRFRVEQYARPLEDHGVRLQVARALFGSYPPRFRPLRPAWAVTSALSRVPDILRSRQFDVVLLQRALLSTFHTLERLTARPRVFDVDDAIWLAPRGRNVDSIASHCDRVITGNAFLADYFQKFCRDIHIVPTAVDTDRFTPRSTRGGSGVVLGWTGHSSAGDELAALAPALARMCSILPDVRVRVMSDRPVRLPGVPSQSLEFVQWSPLNEVATIQSFDIGLMPLRDGMWQRGKCSYKMLLYMACGMPVVVSPTGMNKDVLNMGDVGRSAVGVDAWIESLRELIDDESLRARLGANGRKVVEQSFSVRAIAPQLAAALRMSS